MSSLKLAEFVSESHVPFLGRGGGGVGLLSREKLFFILLLNFALKRNEKHGG